jgi:hypothetical protein
MKLSSDLSLSLLRLTGGDGGDGGALSISPTLAINFVGYTDPSTGPVSSTLEVDFLAPLYASFTPDPSRPESAITSIFVWS